jgi:hypothetical protein
VPRSVGMTLIGHRIEAIYRRYRIASDADLRDAAKRWAHCRAHWAVGAKMVWRSALTGC